MLYMRVVSISNENKWLSWWVKCSLLGLLSLFLVECLKNLLLGMEKKISGKTNLVYTRVCS